MKNQIIIHYSYYIIVYYCLTTLTTLTYKIYKALMNYNLKESYDVL